MTVKIEYSAENSRTYSGLTEREANKIVSHVSRLQDCSPVPNLKITVTP